jgi:hypothetical protein
VGEWEQEVRGQLAAVPVPAPWEPPQLADFRRDHETIAFDPSLSSTGWVHFCVTAAAGLQVYGHGTLRASSDRTGYWGTYDKALQISDQAQDALITAAQKALRRGRTADRVWEAPAVRGHRTESSLIAGYAVWQASGCHGTTVNAQHASRVLCGNPRHDKKEIGAAVARYVPETARRPWTEHERDAFAVGLAYLWDLEHPGKLS